MLKTLALVAFWCLLAPVISFAVFTLVTRGGLEYSSGTAQPPIGIEAIEPIPNANKNTVAKAEQLSKAREQIADLKREIDKQYLRIAELEHDRSVSKAANNELWKELKSAKVRSKLKQRGKRATNKPKTTVKISQFETTVRRHPTVRRPSGSSIRRWERIQAKQGNRYALGQTAQQPVWLFEVCFVGVPYDHPARQEPCQTVSILHSKVLTDKFGDGRIVDQKRFEIRVFTSGKTVLCPALTKSEKFAARRDAGHPKCVRLRERRSDAKARYQVWSPFNAR